MTYSEVVLEGTLQPDGTLVLDGPPDLPPGRVQVVVRPARPPDQQERETLVELVARIRSESEARNHKFMSEQDIAALIEELRADDDRIEKAYSP